MQSQSLARSPVTLERLPGTLPEVSRPWKPLAVWFQPGSGSYNPGSPSHLHSLRTCSLRRDSVMSTGGPPNQLFLAWWEY